MILTKHTPQIAPRKEHRPTPIVPLDARLLAAMRRDHIDLGCFRPDQTHARLLVPVDATAARAEVAVAQVRVGQGALLRGVDGREELVPRDVVVEEELRRDAQVAPGDARSMRGAEGLLGQRGPERSVE